MAKYTVQVTITRETGAIYTRQPEVTWNARRIVDPLAEIGTGTIGHSTPTEEAGVRAGVFESIKHAESIGETLALEDLDVSVERVTDVLKRKKTVDVKRQTIRHVGIYRDIFNEIMARPRPL